MTKNLLFVSLILLVTSCTTNPKTEKLVVIETLIENSLTLEFASKNLNVTKEGVHVEQSEMLHLLLKDTDQTYFQGKTLTLNNSKEGAINFLSRNDSIFCNSSTSLMLMSMPPKPGIRPAMIAAKAEFYVAPMSLLKFESVNIMFVGLVE